MAGRHCIIFVATSGLSLFGLHRKVEGCCTCKVLETAGVVARSGVTAVGVVEAAFPAGVGACFLALEEGLVACLALGGAGAAMVGPVLAEAGLVDMALGGSSSV
jgi:hypothetical protein